MHLQLKNKKEVWNWVELKAIFVQKLWKSAKHFLCSLMKNSSVISHQIKTVRGQGTTRNLEWELHGIPNQLDGKNKEYREL